MTVLSRGEGKFTGIAKGAKRSRKRFPGSLELFSHVNLAFKQKNETALCFLERAVLIQPAIITVGKTAMRLELGDPVPVTKTFHGVIGASQVMQDIAEELEMDDITWRGLMIMFHDGAPGRAGAEFLLWKHFIKATT